MNTNTKNNSKLNASTIVVNRHNIRDAQGRFVSSLVNKVNPVVVNGGRSTNSGSSFISSFAVVGDCVDVVMVRSSKTTYTYKPSKVGLAAVSNVLSSGGSFGEVFNKYLKKNEIKRTIYK